MSELDQNKELKKTAKARIRTHDLPRTLSKDIASWATANHWWGIIHGPAAGEWFVIYPHCHFRLQRLLDRMVFFQPSLHKGRSLFGRQSIVLFCFLSTLLYSVFVLSVKAPLYNSEDWKNTQKRLVRKCRAFFIYL